MLPLVRCPRGNAAEAVATRLDKKIRENLRDARNSLFASDTLQVDPKEPLWIIATSGMELLVTAFRL